MQKRNQIATIIAIILVMILIYISAFTTMNCDKGFHIERLNELANEIKEVGIINYPYYINFEAFGNMGYPTEMFYSDVFLIIPALIINLGVNINIVYAITILMSFIIILISSFLSFKYFLSDKENAIFYSIIYTFSNFILFETIERNALGTNFAYIFVPWTALSFINIISDRRKKYDWMILGISMACLLISHVQTCIIVTIGLFIYAILNLKYIFKNPKVIILLTGSIILFLLLDAFFIFPILEQVIYQKLYFIDKPFTYMNNAYINPLNIVLPNYIWDRIIPRNLVMGNNQITNIIQRMWSIPSLFISTILMLAIIIKKHKTVFKDKWIKQIFIISVFAIILAFIPILGRFKPLSFMQFPWRVITLATVFLPIVFAKTKELEKSTKYKIMLVTLISGIFYLCTLIIFFSSSYSYVETVGRGEYLPIEIPSDKFGYEYATDLNIKNYKNGYIIEKNNNNDIIELPIVSYKGYKVYEVDENKNEYENTNFEKSSNGLIVVKNVKYNNLKVTYDGTVLQKITKYISLITFFVLCIAIIILKKKLMVIYFIIRKI